MSSRFHERVDFDGDFDTLTGVVASAFDLDRVTDHGVIEIGFQDCNVKLTTEKGEYVIKIFSKRRSEENIIRTVENTKRVIEADVNHPALLQCDDGVLYTDAASGLKMIVMKFIPGTTFYDTSSYPDDHDLALIAAEVVKINAIDYAPPYLFDSWAPQNMHQMFEKTEDHLSAEGRKLVEKAFAYYDAIPFEQLPTCFIHGDLLKTNLIKGDDGKIYVIDFSMVNTSPRIQELAIMAVNLLFDEQADDSSQLMQNVERVIAAYQAAGGTLTDVEKKNVFTYALPTAAMEYMGSAHKRFNGDTSEEIVYLEELGLKSLRRALVH